MRKTLKIGFLAGLLAGGLANCKENSSDLAASLCNKASTCGSLSGATAAQCKDMVHKSLQSMASAERADAEKALNACLDSAACSAVASCIETALQGSGGNTTSSGGSGGNTGGNSGSGAGSGGNGGIAAGGNGGISAGGGGSSAGGSGGNNVAAAGGSSVGGSSSGGLAAGGSSGGQAGGAGGGSSSSPAAPDVVTSGPNAFLVKGEVTKVSSGTADVTIDKNTTYQRWDGFGGCFNEMGWDALSVVGADETAKAMSLLFDSQNGASFVYGRIPLGASDYAMDWYTLDDTAGDYSMSKFSIDRDRLRLIPYIKAALKVKPDLHLWASPWVVPSWMKDGSSNMKNDAQTLGAHALYMARFVEEYAKEDLKIEAIHPQNEPGYAQVRWTQAQFVTFIKTYLGPTFAQRNLTTQIWCGTMSKDPDDTNIAKATALDADAMKYVKGFGVQWNLQAAVATLAQKAPVMQTEHKCGNYNFETPYWDKGRYDPNKAQNDHLYGEETWQLIRDWINSGVNSYSAWNMVLDTVGKSLGNWPQNALLVVDRSAKKLIVTPAYYAFRHYSQYVAVGATRVGSTGTDAIAFKNPDGTIVAQVYNKGASAKTMTVGVGSALSQSLYQFTVPSHGWATLRVPQ